MDKNTNLVESIEKICFDLSNIFEKMQTVPGMYDSTVEKYQKLCNLIPNQIHEGVIKVAVVGAIKSGKSTFINSILMDDLLKRGAGTVTSVVTRVRRGDALKASIIFKSWDEINHEIEKALMFMPDYSETRSGIYNSCTDIDQTHASIKNNASDIKKLSDAFDFDSTISVDVDASVKDNSAFSYDNIVTTSLHKNCAKGFDLRRKSDRNFLETIKARLFCGQYSDFSSESGFTGDGLRPEAILIANVLNGYNEVKDFVRTDPYDQDSSPVEFAEESFMEHKRFTGIGCNAFFVKDVLLEIPEGGSLYKSSLVDNIVEIADCQGSDSTDPSHMAHIQDYLLSANMLVYVISSRTGLRDADLKFFNIIKRMGILNNMFFIINADLNEHDSLDSLLELEKSVKQGLEYFVQKPVVYTFSSLFNLFAALEKSRWPDKNVTDPIPSSPEIACNQFYGNQILGSRLSDKDSARLQLWRLDTDLAEYTSKRHIEFEEALKHKIETELFSIILENHIERLRIVVQKSEQRNLIFMKLLSGDLQKVSDASDSLKDLQDQSIRFESSLDDSIENTVSIIKKDISFAIKHFFEKKNGIQAMNVKKFIWGSEIYSERYQEMVATSGFNHALYCMFQDFRSELDLFMTRQFNPAVIELIQEQEDYIEKEFHALCQSCYMSPAKIYSNGSSNSQGALKTGELNHTEVEKNTLLPPQLLSLRSVDLNGAKRILGLCLPKTSFAVAYSAKIRFDAVARFSFYSVMDFWGKIISSIRPGHPRSRALKESAKKIRKEALRSVMIHFDDYQNHVQSDYLFPLVQAVARDLRDRLIDMFRICDIESKHIEQLILDDKTDKLNKLEQVKSIVSAMNSVSDKINDIYIKTVS